tara:strand:+ start:581 stop:934 length:354 start_codon:yes stop_codon:yes gene_type:complete
MKEEIYWVAEMAIINRELVDEKLKKIVDHVKTNEAGALVYEYYFSEDEKRLSIFERYANSDAVLAHIENMQPYFSFFEKGVKVESMIVFGPASREVREFLSRNGAKFQKPAEGFRRG